MRNTHTPKMVHVFQGR